MKSAKELLECAKRELAMRRRSYPNWVLSGRMTEDRSDHEIECMAEIVGLLTEAERRETGQMSLFDPPQSIR